MSQETPGPPLLASPEHCPTADPTAGDYLRAIFLGGLAAFLGGGTWFLTVLVTGRLWGILSIGMGVWCGMAVNKGAGRRRSTLLGALAATYSALGLGTGYFLLLHPDLLGGLVTPRPQMGTLRWFDLLFAAASLALAYRAAGPVRKDLPFN